MSSFSYPAGTGWKYNVDNPLVDPSGGVDVTIISPRGRTLAHTVDLDLPGREIRALAALFENPADARGESVVVKGEEYTVAKADEHSVYARKRPGGIVAVKAGSVIAVGFYGEDQQAEGTINAVEELAADLIKNGC
ncbi:profilin [Streptomyces sp. NPDC059982]|uniref:profilin n=1 Tax=unclassified Streptomyces TaxID=2593676 RepID=UPI00367CB8B4